MYLPTGGAMANQFLPQNLHVLVIDDKLGNPKSKYAKYFDHHLKSSLNEKLKRVNGFSGNVFVHYCFKPAELEEEFLISNYQKLKYGVPIDVILTDIKFDRIHEVNDLSAVFLSKGVKKAGLVILDYLKYQQKRGLSTIPKIVMSGYIDKSIKDEIESVDKNIPIIKKQNNNDWINTCATKIVDSFKNYYKQDFSTKDNDLHLQHILDRIEKEIQYLKSHDITLDNYEKFKSNYPKYQIQLKVKKGKPYKCVIIINNKSRENVCGLLGEKDENNTLSKFKADVITKIDVPSNAHDNIINQLNLLFREIRAKTDFNKNNENEFGYFPHNLFKDNYYGIQKGKYLQVNPEKCNTICKACLKVCPNDAISEYENKSMINIEKCTLCKNCLSICPYDAIDFFSPPINGSRKFGGKDFFNPLFLAATPVTAVSGYDVNSDLTLSKIYLNKLLNLYETGTIGGIILKTVYLDEINIDTKKNPINLAEKIKSPLTIRELSMTRAFTAENDEEIKEIYNTGKTARENIMPNELSKFLDKILLGLKDGVNGKIEGYTFSTDEFLDSIILSIGSHKDSPEVWDELFRILFGERGEKNKRFNFIEVNVRHVMRRISKDCSKKEGINELKPYVFGVDEYFISPDLSNYTGFWKRFEEWVEHIQLLGQKYEKYLMLKLPYRSDLNMLVYIIRKSVHKLNLINKYDNIKRYGITSISAINTIKSPYPIDDLIQNGVKPDLHKLPQISGVGLSRLRDITLYTLKNICGEYSKNLDSDGLDISASGGIMTEADIDQCIALGAKTVQLSTLYLTKGKVSWKPKKQTEGRESHFYVNSMKIGMIPRRKVKFYPERCSGCGKCTDTYYCDAIVNKFNKGQIEGNYLVQNSPIIYDKFCTGCGLCTSVCKHNALVIEYENALDSSLPEYTKLSKCPVCGNNSEEKKIFIYPLDSVSEKFIKKYELPDEKEYVKQSYFCSKCQVLYSKIYTLDEGEIKKPADFTLIIEGHFNISIKDNNVSPIGRKVDYNFTRDFTITSDKIETNISHLVDFTIDVEKDKEYIPSDKNVKNAIVFKGSKRDDEQLYSVHAIKENQPIVIEFEKDKGPKSPYPKIILATGSKVKAKLFSQLGLQYKTNNSEYEEKINHSESAELNVKRLSLEKANVVSEKHNNTIIIAADTIFDCNGELLGKPHTKEKAKETLQKIQGKKVKVYSGYTILHGSNVISGHEITDVIIREMDEDLINKYIETGEPLNKAGSLGIQGLGTILVEKVDGDYNCVVGLPLRKIAEGLKKMGVDVLELNH